MCGLILAPKRFAVKVQNALQRMDYRGDVDQDIVTYDQWTIGHVRLAIQDRTRGGHQPFYTGQGLTAFVGEFFNHGGMGEKAYLERIFMHQDRFHEADGFWSIVRVTGQSAVVYTDHLAIKPLYYWRLHDIICSELEPMFELAPRPPLDETYLSNCIKFGYDYSGRTPYQGITQLPPGTRLDIDPDGTEMRTYWDWSKVPQHQDLSLRETVQEAIANRLVSDLPVAMLLSGGLDSSIIYYTLQRMGKTVQAFSVENGESEFIPGGVPILALNGVSIEAAVAIMQAPLDLGSLLPQIQLARAVADAGYSVCLTGDGADEVFGGYRRAMEYDSQRSDIFCELPYYHLPRLDRVMMYSTIELRSPFLAPSVVAAGLRLPHEYRSHKQALKAAFKGIVPDRIIERTKHPLKTQAVINGGTNYRAGLVEAFRLFVERSRIR